MSKHEWRDSVSQEWYYATDDPGEPRDGIAPFGSLPLPMTGAAAREILRFAEHVQALESAGEALLSALADNGSYSLDPLSAITRAAEWIRGTRENILLEEAVAPLLPLFRERAGAWDRMRDREAESGFGYAPPETITLTAEFSVATLRALSTARSEPPRAPRDDAPADGQRLTGRWFQGEGK